MLQLYLFVFIFTILRVWKEYVILEKKKVGHSAGWCITAFTFFSIIWFIQTKPFISESYYESFLYLLGTISVFWIPYNLFLNLSRKKKWNYHSSGVDGSWIDRFGVYNEFIFKPICLFYTIVTLIHYY